MQAKINPCRRSLIFTALLIVSLLSQVVTAMPVQAASYDTQVSLDQGTGTREPATRVVGELPVVGTGTKSDVVEPDTSKEIPSLESPVASADPQKESGEVPAPSRDRAWNVLMTEDFEGVFPGTGWTAFDGDGPTNGEYYWDDDDYLAYQGYWSAWVANGGANGLDPSSSFYPNDANSWMIYGPFDLSNCTSADFEFQWWNQSEEDFDYFFWGASADGMNFNGTQFSGDSAGWVAEDFNLASYLGDSSVYLAFAFVSDLSYTDDGAFVDNITLWCNQGTSTSDEWTFMVYLDGDNDLEQFGIGDFLEMSSVGSGSNVNIVAQMDRIPGYDSTHDNWTDTRRFYITNGMTPTAANGTSIGEVNMGDPQTLIDFVNWAKSTYPANHYALVLWNHGSGWRVTEEDELLFKGIAYDDTSGGDGLQMNELRSALNTLTGGGADALDVLGMDACLMAMIEVDDQIRPYADFRVGSQELEPGEGWPYDMVLSALVANPTMSSDELVTEIADDYYASYGNDETQSAVDLGSAYESLDAAVDNFANVLIANGNSYVSEIQAARENTQAFDDSTYVDLYDFASEVYNRVNNSTIDAAATAVMNAVNAVIVREQHGPNWPDAHGISIYFPTLASEYDSRYDGGTGFLQLTADTHWDEWIHAYHNLASSADSYEPDNDAASASWIDAGSSQTHSIVPASDVDWVKFTLNATSAVTLETSGSSDVDDTVIWLYNSSLAPIEVNDDGGVDYYSLIDRQCNADALPAGTYYVKVNGYYNDDEIPSYRINLITTPCGVSRIGDFNGDGMDDIAVYRPSNGTWYISTLGNFVFGQAGDVPVLGDYNGDWRDDVAVYRPSNGTWYISTLGNFVFGQAGDIPVPGDYNGDRRDDVAVYRPSDGTWYISTRGNFRFGEAGDIPVPGDYNGDGMTDIAVYRPSNGTWYISTRGNFVFGQAGDVPIPGDYNRDGMTDIAVFRPSNGTWYISTRGNFLFGQAGDVPLPGDFNGDGMADIAVFRSSNEAWYISTRGNFRFGQGGDIPL